MKMLRSWLDAYGILSPSMRRRAWLILVVFVASSIMEVTGVVSIVPFLAVLGSPAVITSRSVISCSCPLISGQFLGG